MNLIFLISIAVCLFSFYLLVINLTSSQDNKNNSSTFAYQINKIDNKILASISFISLLICIIYYYINHQTKVEPETLLEPELGPGQLEE